MARPLHSRQAGVPPLPTPQCPMRAPCHRALVRNLARGVGGQRPRRRAMRTESGPLAGELNKWRRSPSGGEAVVSRGGAASLAGGVGSAGLVDLAGSGGRGGGGGWAGWWIWLGVGAEVGGGGGKAVEVTPSFSIGWGGLVSMVVVAQEAKLVCLAPVGRASLHAYASVLGRRVQVGARRLRAI